MNAKNLWGVIELHISRLLFKKGISEREGKNESMQWKECEIEITLNQGDNPDLARETAETLFDAWGLKGKVTVKNPESTSKKTCAWEGCDKQVDAKFKYCYPHFQQIRGKQT